MEKITMKKLKQYQDIINLVQNKHTTKLYNFDDETIKTVFNSGDYYNSIEDIHNKYLLAILEVEPKEHHLQYIELFTKIWGAYVKGYVC